MHDLEPLAAAGRIDVLRADSVAGCFERLAAERVDFVPVNRFTAATAVRTAGLDPESFRMSRRPFHRDTLNLLISPRTDRAREVLSDFNEALRDLQDQGRLRTLRSEHIAHYRSPQRAGPWTATFGDRQAPPPSSADTTADDGTAAADAQARAATAEDDADGADAAATAPDEHADVAEEGEATEGSASDEVAGEPLRLVSGPDYGPFADPEQPEGGMTTEIVRRVAEIMGRPLDIDFRPWQEGYRAAAANEYHGTYPYVRTSYRRGDFVFSEALYSMPIRIFTRSDSDLRYEGLNDLRGTTVCKAAGYYRNDVEDLVAAGFAELVEGDSLAACFRQLHAGEVDFVPISRYTGEEALRHLDDLEREDFRILDQPLAEVDLHLMVPDSARKTYSLIGAFDRALQELEESGELQAIQERHLELHETRTR